MFLADGENGHLTEELLWGLFSWGFFISVSAAALKAASVK